jgi:LysR family tcuABC transcriptional regulator
MLRARQLDLAVLFQADRGQRWSVLPVLDERLFLIARPGLAGLPDRERVEVGELADLPLILPSNQHGLRALLNAASSRGRYALNVVAEIDGLAVLMDAVRAGYGATIQPGAALARLGGEPLVTLEIADSAARRPNLLTSLSDDELSPAGLAARVVLQSVMRELVQQGRWPGATLHES